MKPKCCICGKVIPAPRLEMLPIVKTCSKACSARHKKNLLAAAARRRRAREREARKAKERSNEVRDV